MRKKKNAFTLIELLAVIAILAIILVISIPKILDVIEESKVNTLKNTIKLIADSAEKKYTENEAFDEEEDITCESISKLSSDDYKKCTITFDEEGKAKVNILCKNKFEGYECTGNSANVTCNMVTDEKYFTYVEVEGGIEITDYKEEGGKDVVIPSMIEGSNVISIGTRAFYYNQLTSVTIPNSVTSIGNSAFYYNKLTSVIIPSSVTTIGWGAFRNNQLTSVIISEGVKAISAIAFIENKITSVIIPNSVIKIEGGAFNNNQLSDKDAFIYKRNSDGSIDNTTIVSYGGKNKSPIIPNTVTTIGVNAFYSNQLTSVIIPSSVTSIEQNAFYGNNLTSVTIPNSVTSIGSRAFHDNKLTRVTIPNSVTSIGSGAFRKVGSSNLNLTKIINKTGKSFDWGSIVNDSYGYNFVTGTVVNSYGNVEVVSE